MVCNIYDLPFNSHIFKIPGCIKTIDISNSLTACWVLLKITKSSLIRSNNTIKS